MAEQIEQRSLEWFRTRLGNFTGSEVGKLMKPGRKKEDIFGDTAKTYIYEVAFERDLNPKIVDDDFFFQNYLDQTSVHSKAMDWGTENEENARNLYQRITGNQVEECSSIKHPTIEHFASSPDGYVCGDEKRIALEIKCLGKTNYAKYRALLDTPEDLKSLNDIYYWQCVAHMAVTGAQECHFFVYNPFVKHPYILLVIPRSEEEISLLEERVRLANDFINNNINLNKSQDNG